MKSAADAGRLITNLSCLRSNRRGVAANALTHVALRRLARSATTELHSGGVRLPAIRGLRGSW